MKSSMDSLVTRRRRYSDLGNPIDITKHWDAISREAHARVVETFEKYSLSTRHINPQRFVRLMREPEDQLDEDVVSTFAKFLTCSPLVTGKLQVSLNLTKHRRY